MKFIFVLLATVYLAKATTIEANMHVCCNMRAESQQCSAHSFPVEVTLDSDILPSNPATIQPSPPSTTESTKECPTGWKSFSNSCYKLGRKEVTYPEAKKECATEGAHVVSINSDEENEFINGFSSECISVWTDYHALGEGWTHVYEPESNYSNWRPHEPNFDFSNTKVEIGNCEGNEKLWSNYPPTNTYFYVCETFNDSSELSPSTTEATKSCPSGWKMYSDSCYKLSEEQVMYPVATQACASEKAHVISINSDAENEFVNGLSSECKSIWTDYTKLDATWVHIYETESNYSNWDVLEPGYHFQNSKMDIGDCKGGEKLWSNYPPSNPYYYVCEKEIE